VSIGDAVVQVYYLYPEQVAQTVMTGHKRYKVMSNELDPKKEPSQPVVYQISIKGHLGREWTDWFSGLTITLEDNGITLLTGPVNDQAALHGLLKKVRDLGLPLLSVIQIEPGMEDASKVKPSSPIP
jgi:hypothetical protein